MRSAAAVADGWDRYERVYRPAEYDPAVLQEVRTTRLAHILRIAAERGSPAMRAALAGVPVAADPFAALDRLPELRRDEIVADPDSLRTGLVSPADVLRLRTSGTTGPPLVVEYDESRLTESVAAHLRLWHAYGVEPGSRVLKVSCDRRHGLVHFDSQPSLGLSQVLRVNVARLDDGNAERVRWLVAEFAPTVLWGQPMELLVAAREARTGRFAAPPPALVMSHGDTLDRSTRAAIQDTFGRPVRDVLGMQEFGRIAWECPEAPGTYHVEDEKVLAGAAPDGALLLTNLTNTAMLILRYRPEDQAELLGPGCPCGRALSRLTGIQGRRQRGVLVDRRGRHQAVEPVGACLAGLPVLRWQVRQSEPGRLQVVVVPGAGAAPDTAAIAARIGALIDLHDVDVRAGDLESLMTDRAKAPQFQLYATQRHLADLVPGPSSP
jgi:phenylacetate-CoA ligase